MATAVLLAGPLSTGADAQTPSYYPSGFTLGTTAYTMRFAGTNRFQTAGTIAITGGVNSGGNDAYPFDQPDKTNPGTTFSGAQCPAIVGISASDTPADALAASQAWETNLDGVGVHGGGTQNGVNTRDGYMLLTSPNRDGSSPDLDPSTITAIQALRNRCGNFDSMVFGGSAAVSDTAISTLDALTSTVYQFAGTDRFDTARQIAVANFANHGLSSVTDFTSATTQTSLPNTVFLAEGITGADALAIGPYAAENNIPVLLTNSGALPDATRLGLIEMAPQNIVVLGGTAAISDAVASAAAAAAGGATITRIAGTDRFLSSIQISERLFDNYPEFALTNGNANGDYSGAEWAFARSEGSGANHVGWPDALASAWFLGGLDNENLCPPDRLAPPIEKNVTDTFLTACADFDIPLLLTTASGLPASVSSYLASLYPDATNIVTATSQSGNDDGGFGFIFGGTAAVSAAAEGDIATALSGGTYTSANRSDLSPTMNAGSVFYTGLNFSGYTAGGTADGGFENGGSGNDKICAQRNAFTGSQFMAEYDPADGSFTNSRDLTVYQPTGDGFAAGQSRPQCVDSAANADSMASVMGISLSGHETGAKALDWSNAANLLIAGPNAATTLGSSSETPSNCNVFTGDQADGTTCTGNFSFSGALPVVTLHGSSVPTATFTLALQVKRTDPADTVNNVDAITTTGTLTVSNGATTLFTANLTGEARNNAGTLMLSGMYSEAGALGGFRVTLTGPTGTAALTDLNLNGLGA